MKTPKGKCRFYIEAGARKSQELDTWPCVLRKMFQMELVLISSTVLMPELTREAQEHLWNKKLHNSNPAICFNSQIE